MQQKRFTVVGELAWQLALNDVVMDNLLTGQASASTWQSGVVGAVFEVAQILAQVRQQVAIVSAVGADAYGQLIINQLDLSGIDSEAVLIDDGRSTNLRCLVNSGKKDSLAIVCATAKLPTVSLSDEMTIGDWLYIISQGDNLNQVNEWLHQAFLQQSKVILQLEAVTERDTRRAGYLLEDVDTLIVPAEVAQALTTKADLDQAATILLNDVQTVVITAKKRLVVAQTGRLVGLEATDVEAKAHSLAAWVVAGLVRVKQPDLARVVAMAWRAVSDKNPSLREKSL